MSLRFAVVSERKYHKNPVKNSFARQITAYSEPREINKIVAANDQIR